MATMRGNTILRRLGLLLQHKPKRTSIDERFPPPLRLEFGG
jgi:hypothetical protein